MSENEIPRHLDLMWPTLQAIKSLGGSARIDETVEWVVANEGFTEEQQAVRRRPDDHMSMIEYRMAWARNYLKNIGAIENSARGVWSITDGGRSMTPEELPVRVKKWKTEYNRAYYEAKKGEPTTDDTAAEAEVVPEDAWKETLLSRLMEMTPDGFERLGERGQDQLDRRVACT